MSDKPLFCSNCKHLLLGEHSCGPGFCDSPNTARYDLVTGDRIVVTAEHTRSEDGKCGPTGLFFEAKE